MNWLLEPDEVVNAAGALNVPPRQLLEVARVLNPAQLRRDEERFRTWLAAHPRWHGSTLAELFDAEIAERREAGL
jgi:hypothetical protein